MREVSDNGKYTLMDNGSRSSSAPSSDNDIIIVYDGECPFCKQYMRLLRLRANASSVRLLDARDDDPQIDEIVRRGYNLDQGMIVIIADQFYHGAEAMHVLAMLSTRAGWFNRLNSYIFRSKRVTTFLYPVLRGGRNMALRILGREPIDRH